jgi:iron complex outermembrane receptor protein
LALGWLPAGLMAQHSLTVRVLDEESRGLPGVSVVVEALKTGALTDAEGIARLSGLPPGSLTLSFSLETYQTQARTVTLPLPGDSLPAVRLTAVTQELKSVVIEATRSNRSIDQIPTRVEVLTDEVEEAAIMDPGKVAHLLTHSTGLQVQQTSATSGAANVRIQGLDGRYTQLLRDGFPLYGGFSGSLSIMQVPPLDLRQVEFIKGSASTLYGAGAISGLINLVSIEPTAQPRNVVHLNASHVGAVDVNAFAARKWEKIGMTLLAARNSQQAYDPNHDGYADLPQVVKYSVQPRLYFYPGPRAKIWVGATLNDEKRTGGDMHLIAGETPNTEHFYAETTESQRFTTQAQAEVWLPDSSRLCLRNSVSVFDRSIHLPGYRFAGQQLNTFSEISYRFSRTRHELVSGLNLYSDRFRQRHAEPGQALDQDVLTAGAFANYNLALHRRIALETGLRYDYVSTNGSFLLPRIAALFRFSPFWSSRLGGGLGYRTPTVFNPEADQRAYQNVLPVVPGQLQAEHSYSLNADLTWLRQLSDNWSLRLNQQVFFARIDNPLLFRQPDFSPSYAYVNADGHFQSYGAETWLKLAYKNWTLFAGIPSPRPR